MRQPQKKENYINHPGATAPIVEIFSSIQGEGIHAGERHCFVRFAGCNLACRYCDTVESRTVPEVARIENHPMQRDFHEIMNPVSMEAVLEACTSLDKPGGFHDALAVTGGEPLLYPEFLEGLLPQLKERGWKILLETNGTLNDALSKIIHHVDVVSMDIKIQSATGKAADLETNRRFLAAAAKTGVYVKIVVVEETTEEEISAVAETIAAVDSTIPTVIQPCTKPDGKTLVVKKITIEKLRIICEKTLCAVRIIPQLHKLHSLP